MKDPRFLARYGIKVNQPVAGETAIAVGGNADFFVTVEEPAQFRLVASAAQDNALKTVVIGRGTHTVFSDHGLRGLVIKNQMKGLEILQDQVTVGSGLGLTELVHRLAEESYGGLEELASVPRSVGGAIWANSQVGDTVVADYLSSVRLYSKGRMITVTPPDLEFGRDDSRLQRSGEFVVEATFRVRRESRERINQKILKATQDRLRQQPGARHAIRVFRNPVGETASDLIRQIKLAGERLGGVTVSSKDPNYLINEGGAKAAEVYELAQRIKHRVSIKLHQKLREAVVWVGEW